MTANQLIIDIFSRVQCGVSSNMRRITKPQLDWLRSLIVEETGRADNSGSMHWGDNNSLVWSPPGADKYILTEDPHGDKHTLLCLPSITVNESGLLFPVKDGAAA